MQKETENLLGLLAAGTFLWWLSREPSRMNVLLTVMEKKTKEGMR